MPQAGEDYSSCGIDDPAVTISEPRKGARFRGPDGRSQAFVSYNEVTAGKHRRG